jgi:hypothetical protein
MDEQGRWKKEEAIRLLFLAVVISLVDAESVEALICGTTMEHTAAISAAHFGVDSLANGRLRRSITVIPE